MRTSNPAMRESVFTKSADPSAIGSSGSVMTVQGAAYKTMMLLGLVVVAASYTWRMTLSATTPEEVIPWVLGGAFGGLIFALVTVFVPKASPFTAPIYAVLEGLFLGAFSAGMETQYPGIVVPAVGMTLTTLAAMLVAYVTGIIKVTEKFRMGLFAATTGIMLMYLLTFFLGFFGITVPFIHESGAMGIAFSVFVVVVAALNLVLDFDIIDRGAQAGAPRYMEWYGAFALLVTLVWLYLEILRLLAKMRRN